MKLLKIIKEINIKMKDKIGYGTDHAIYPFNHQSGKVIKTSIENKEFNPKHSEFMSKYPDIFPKVYKITDKYSVVEKLDTNKVRMDAALIRGIVKGGKALSGIVQTILDNDVETIQKLKNIGNSKLPHIQDIIKNWSSKIQSWLTLGENIAKLSKTYPNILNDLHDKQIGYDSEGKLKLLDF